MFRPAQGVSYGVDLLSDFTSSGRRRPLLPLPGPTPFSCPSKRNLMRFFCPNCLLKCLFALPIFFLRLIPPRLATPSQDSWERITGPVSFETRLWKMPFGTSSFSSPFFFSAYFPDFCPLLLFFLELRSYPKTRIASEVYPARPYGRFFAPIFFEQTFPPNWVSAFFVAQSASSLGSSTFFIFLHSTRSLLYGFFFFP